MTIAIIGGTSRIVSEISTRRSSGKKVSFVSGNFNVVHPGHLRLLKFASELGQILVVGVNPDHNPGVVVPLDLRMESARSISFVKYVVSLDTTPNEFISALKPDFVVKGKEFESLPNPEQSAVDEYGGRLVFNSGELRFSSFSLLEREYLLPNLSAVKLPSDFLFRYSFGMADLRSLLAKFSGLRVFVIGDLIVDDYTTCDPVGMSQEDPTIVVTPIETKTFVGGAGVVAANSRKLGTDVRLATVVGEDDAANIAMQSLEEYGVHLDRFVDSSRPTTRKQRFRALNKTLLRVNHLRQHPISLDLQRQMFDSINAHLPHTDLVLFACYNYGCLPQALVNEIIVRATELGVMMSADSQASSQFADISRFRNMTLITPTEHEARLALQDFGSGLAIISERLKQKAAADNLIITLGPEGSLINTVQKDLFLTDRLPAFNTSPKDVAGAGDSYFTTTSVALCAGADIWKSAYLGAMAAGLQISRVGNSPITKEELIAEIDNPNFDSNDHL
jgi:rfaE bifunctional protein kinase chain/domain